jgi:hypothetical protein
VLDSRIAKKFGLRREEGRKNWKKWYNKELHNLQFSPNITIIRSRRLIYGTCRMYGGERNLNWRWGGGEWGTSGLIMRRVERFRRKKRKLLANSSWMARCRDYETDKSAYAKQLTMRTEGTAT